LSEIFTISSELHIAAHGARRTGVRRNHSIMVLLQLGTEKNPSPFKKMIDRLTKMFPKIL